MDLKPRAVPLRSGATLTTEPFYCVKGNCQKEKPKLEDISHEMSDKDANTVKHGGHCIHVAFYIVNN